MFPPNESGLRAIRTIGRNREVGHLMTNTRNRHNKGTGCCKRRSEGYTLSAVSVEGSSWGEPHLRFSKATSTRGDQRLESKD
jgi:hypothetical protein